MADEPAAPEGAQTTAAGDSPAGSADRTAAPAGSGAAEKTFTQAQLDKILEDRLARQRAQFGDVDELKAKASRLDELEASQQSEAEKQRAAREKAEQKAADAEQRANQTLEAANDRLRRAAVVAEAAKQGAVDGEDVFRLLDASKLTIDDDGNVQGADVAVKGLLEAKPHLIGSASMRIAPAHFDGGTGGTPGAAPEGAPKVQSPMNAFIRQAVGAQPQP
jgi:hypothetical protein